MAYTIIAIIVLYALYVLLGVVSDIYTDED